TDLHHMRATDASVNSERGDKDFDNCQATGTQHDEATQCYFTSNAWEPPASVKGDIARAMFYMAVRYEGDSGEADLELTDFYTSPSSSPGQLGILETLMQWHQTDPVDAKEMTRHELVYNNYQGNRNPFIDHPEYVDLIWGDGLAEEPLNHPTDFSAHTITINWTDAVGPVEPDGYLLRMSSSGFGSISNPVDGIPITDDFWNLNVPFGTEKAVFKGLTPSTVYYFKIFGYAGNGNEIDYKIDGSVQQISIEAN
ncbi:MAG: endonuclease, partial [Bacteroidales bacterium]|nr:endonuclease [Bacteroidales bacterium]